MSKTGAWVIAEQERREALGLPDEGTSDDSNWKTELTAMLASGDPERITGHNYATGQENRDHIETNTTPASWE